MCDARYAITWFSNIAPVQREVFFMFVFRESLYSRLMQILALSSFVTTKPLNTCKVIPGRANHEIPSMCLLYANFNTSCVAARKQAAPIFYCYATVILPETAKWSIRLKPPFLYYFISKPHYSQQITYHWWYILFKQRNLTTNAAFHNIFSCYQGEPL